MKSITPPNEEMLEKSINNNIFYYNVFLVLWLATTAYSVYLFVKYNQVSIWWIGSMILFIAGCYFGLAQKIDKARLEILKK